MFAWRAFPLFIRKGPGRVGIEGKYDVIVIRAFHPGEGDPFVKDFNFSFVREEVESGPVGREGVA